MECPQAYFDTLIVAQPESKQVEEPEPVRSKKDEGTTPNNNSSSGGGNSESVDCGKIYNCTRVHGLGTMNVFADWMIMRILRFLDAQDLVQLSLVSRAFYIYADENDIWKDLCIRKRGGDFRFKGTWKRTTLLPREKDIPTPYQKLAIPDFHSDYLYRRWYRGTVPMSFFSELPKDLPPHLQVPRRSGLSVKEFIDEYVNKNKPVILTDVVTKWPAWKERLWTKEALIKRFPTTLFRVDQTDDDGHKLNMTLGDYFEYCSQTQDEDPIYVFCPLYGDRAPTLLEDYAVPDYFPEDFFSLMGSERPFYRWIVIGGPRSGSSFHLDPFKTSAWNALLAGRKRWVLYPPGQVPPSGVDADEDEDTGEIDYTGEDPVVWFLEHYPQIMRSDPKNHPIECILEEGEIIYVPTNWWHMVFNLTESIAVTQNFCDSYNFTDVYNDLSKDKDFTKGLYLFTEKMLMIRPDLMAKVSIPKSYWRRKEKKRLKELAKREELKSQIENAEQDVKEGEEHTWTHSSFWRVPPSLEDLDEDERHALKNSKIHHVPPLFLSENSSEDETSSSSDEGSSDEGSSESTESTSDQE